MKKLRSLIHRNGIFLASLLFVVMICLPQLLTGSRVASAEEELIITISRGMLNIVSLRFIILGLIVVNTTLVYSLLSAWMSRRRAGLSIFILASIPVWLLSQISIPRFALAMTPLLIGLWAFDRAGRAEKATGWYSLSGLSLTVSWILEPIGTSIIMAISLLLLAVIKPRYIKHIARQGSLVIIILAVALGAVAAAAWKFGLGLQTYIIHQLGGTVVVTSVPRVLWEGPHHYHFGLPGVPLVPIAVMALAGLGAWQLFVGRKRPRNLYILIFPVLLTAIAVQFTSITTLMLFSVSMICIAVWAVMGVQYLHNSWKRVFPHNKLANSLGDALIALLLASLVMYSFWYINKAWAGSPTAQEQAKVEWNGSL